MDTKLQEIIKGQEGNYLFPFYWQHGDHTDKIPEQIQTIYDSGCRAFCVESRPHPDFVGESWWRDMDIILAEAKKRGMKVWLLDDDHCPTGHAAGIIAKKYPDLRQWNLTERHLDICGPMEDGAILVSETSPDHILLGAFAYRRRYDHDEICEIDGIDLTKNIRGGYLYWNVPEGLWRIFFYYKTRQGIMKDYIDMTREESVHALIEAVYESHYEHYSEYFGNTFAGFFSDEPCFGNDFRYGVPKLGYIGNRGNKYPWNDDLVGIMKEKLGYDPIPHLNLLWYEDGQGGDFQCEYRYVYMNTICEMYSRCFNKQLGDWCRAHGVMYTGHICEGASTAIGAGHFFKATRWQDMSGIDIVLHAVMPGMDAITHSSSCSSGYVVGDYPHYVLAKLGASLAHIEPRMHGRAMCEVFGAYGWAEDTTLMKYLMDFLLVRGINHFVPHAFDSKFPDPDCPPHFGVEGKDPSFDGFSALMSYTNKAAHLLHGTTHVAKVAVLYTDENQWSSHNEAAMGMSEVAMTLYDAHLDFDIVPLDYLSGDRIRDGKLCLGDEAFECLVIPYADHLAADVAETLECMDARGLKLIFVNECPKNYSTNAEVIPLDNLAGVLTEGGMENVIFEGGHARVRVYHGKRDGHDIFMFANEERHAVHTTATLPCIGEFARIDLANDEMYRDQTTESGAVSLSLEPSQSMFLVFGTYSELAEAPILTKTEVIHPKFELSLADYEDLTTFETVGLYDHFFNITGPDFKPDFSGRMRYRFTIDAEKNGRQIQLDLGRVGQSARLTVNGVDLGVRFSSPYTFDVTEALRDGVNDICVTVGNTLAQTVRDRYSFNLLIAPAGLLGDMALKYYK